MAAEPTTPHRPVAAVAVVRQALKDVAHTDPVFLPTHDKATLLHQIVAAEAQLADLKLRTLASADDLADDGANRDIAAWLHHHTRSDHASARRLARLAHALDRRYPTLATALRHGEATLDQARVIVRALDALPGEVDADTRSRAEAALVGHCSEFDPRALARLGRRVLDVIAPEIAEAADARALAALEAAAVERTRLTLRRCGDGTTRITGRVSDPVATRLAVYLEALTNPRVVATPAADGSTVEERALRDASSLGSSGEPQRALVPEEVAQRPSRRARNHRDAQPDPVNRLPYPRALGQAFCQFLETLDPDRLPLHGGDATTLIVTIGLDQLRTDLATGDLLTTATIPGDDATAGGLTAGQVRRLACTAQILPAVLDGASIPLDLGRARRLFTPAQRKALLLRDRTCRAEGCDIPGTWAEAHHLHPWSHGGPTDLDHGILLCRFHHHRAHDPTYTTSRLPNGDLRYTMRT